MKRIGLLSDTHGYLDPRIMFHLEDCDEIWHAGDFGTIDVSDQLANFRPLRGVYGNVDGKDIRMVHPLEHYFILEGVSIRMIHIGGYPNHYAPGMKAKIQLEPSDLFICGHSHILKVMPDKELKTLAVNPGAAGKHGFHKIRTMIKMDLNQGKIENMKVIELGKRA